MKNKKKISISIGNDLFNEPAYVECEKKQSTIGLSYVADVCTVKKTNYEPVFIDSYSVNPAYAFFFRALQNKRNNQSNFKDQSTRKQTFQMTKQALRKMKNCFTWLYLISNYKEVYSKKENKKFKFRLSFITLTLPADQKHHDNYIKDHILAPFLLWMKRYHYCNSYIWKAEAQSNNRIHFHITTNKFIHWKSVRAKWNKILSNHGYCKCYQDGTNDKGDAATQIKAVRKDRQIAYYMFKYFCKDEINKRRIDGRIWGASTNLNVSNAVIDQTRSQFIDVERWLNNTEQIKKIKKDTGILYVSKAKLFDTAPTVLKALINKKIRQMRKADVIVNKYVLNSLFE